MLHVGDRGHTELGPNLLVVLRPFGGHHEEGRGSLRVSCIEQLTFLSDFQSLVDHSRQVVVANLVPTEPPVLRIFVWIQVGVLSGVPVASGVS